MALSRSKMSTPTRRATLVVAAVAVAFGGASLTAAPAIAGTPTTTLTLAFPHGIGNGGDLQDATASINNTGSTIPTGRIDFDITPNSGTANLHPSDFVIFYEVPTTTTYQPLPLSQDSSGGGVNGFYGPADGYPIATGTTTAHFLITTNPDAPTGGITVTAKINANPTGTASYISTATANIVLTTPALTFTNFPSALSPGAVATNFTSTVTNNTGSNYGGSNAASFPAPAGLQLAFSIVSSNLAVTANQLTLQYCSGGTGSACTGGTWKTVTLTNDGSGTFTGSTAAADQFALPSGATHTTAYRISAAAGTPAATLITHVALDKVDSAGSTAGTDSAGVANGTIETVSAGTTVIKTTSTTKLTLSKNPAQAGDTVTAVAAVTPASATGTVQFAVDGTNVGNPVALTGGSATTTLPTTLTVGNHTVIATYSGDATNAASSASATLAVTAATVTNPTIVAHLTSASGPSSAGWYRSAVTITYTCTPGSSAINSAGCPTPVTITDNGSHVVTRTVTDTDGGTDTNITAVAIDHSKPHVHVRGASSGATYKHHRHLRVSCNDHLSGIAKCTLHSHHGRHHTVHYVATARDKAGNKAHRHGHYTIKH